MVGVGSARKVHLHRVVYDQINGNERFDTCGVCAELCGGVAHCGEVYEQRDSREVLQNDSRNDERHFVVCGILRAPRCEAFDVVFCCEFAVAVAQDAFEDYSYADGQAGYIEARFCEGGEAINKTFRAGLFGFKFSERV